MLEGHFNCSCTEVAEGAGGGMNDFGTFSDRFLWLSLAFSEFRLWPHLNYVMFGVGSHTKKSANQIKTGGKLPSRKKGMSSL